MDGIHRKRNRRVFGFFCRRHRNIFSKPYPTDEFEQRRALNTAIQWLQNRLGNVGFIILSLATMHVTVNVLEKLFPRFFYWSLFYKPTYTSISLAECKLPVRLNKRTNIRMHKNAKHVWHMEQAIGINCKSLSSNWIILPKIVAAISCIRKVTTWWRLKSWYFNPLRRLTL